MKNSVVPLSVFYTPKSLVIKNLCEIYYICELGKYLYRNYGRSLSLQQWSFHFKVLQNTPVFDYVKLAKHSKWLVFEDRKSREFFSDFDSIDFDTTKIVNVFYTTEDFEDDRAIKLKRLSDVVFNYSEPIKRFVSFRLQNKNTWYFAMYGKNGKYFDKNNLALTGEMAYYNWISLVAMVAVERYVKKSPNRLQLEISQSVLFNNDEATIYLEILSEHTTVLKDWVDLVYDSNIPMSIRNNVNYVSWFKYGSDLGYLCRDYSVKEKLEYMKKRNICIGDIVVIYDRKHTRREDYLKSIIDCHIAKILDISDRGLTIEVFNTRYPKYHNQKMFELLPQEVQEMYKGNKPYEQFNSVVHKEDWNDIGVEYLMNVEYKFIVRLSETNDTCEYFVQKAVKKKKIEDLICTNQAEMIYWMLSDYNVAFDKKRFCQKNFVGKHIALYERFMNSEDLDSKFVLEEDKL